MPIVPLKLPKMGESISEATIISWLKNVGDTIEIEETILEVATDKVDSEVPSPCTGIITEIRFQANDVVPIGEVIALIDASETSNIEQEISNDKVKSETVKSPQTTNTSSSNNSEFKTQHSAIII